ncbi:YgjP-like metallopeptidase domain-containing protein [Desulfosarcina cetonica]|uniref:YgjP-like metallopeptidase domain-containing protein n=1 Tax=Desulfosarcina cetonica TaxID=90730 RepID=UPI001FEE0B9D|nr:YgjP-like metallopeptidase domain-containing protein [Desulfosarcina cetonica]
MEIEIITIVSIGMALQYWAIPVDANKTSILRIISAKDSGLPFTLIDYILVYGLAHIRHKLHSKEFDKEVAKFIPYWKGVDERLCGMKL